MSAPREFAATIGPQVVHDCINTGIFPSVVIAQAIQESGSGSSTMAVKFNNIFGHAASALWPGKKGQTVKGGHWWRIYDSIADAISAQISILKKPLYRLAGVITAKTPFEQAQKIQSAGFNQGPDRQQYAAKLDRIIRSLHLQQYDEMLFAIERKSNSNGLAFHEQPAATKIVHQIFG